MCLAPSTCSLDVGFFDKGRRLITLPKSKTNIYSRCRLEFAFLNWPRKIHEIGLLTPIETS
jgi:hypothetical protein